MPYIPQDYRKWIDEGLEVAEIRSAGDLNYAITKLCVDYIDVRKLSYDNLNEVMGVLASAQAEFYRRKVAPYEDTKITQNGDVY